MTLGLQDPEGTGTLHTPMYVTTQDPLWKGSLFERETLL